MLFRYAFKKKHGYALHFIRKITFPLIMRSILNTFDVEMTKGKPSFIEKKSLWNFSWLNETVYTK